MHTTLITSSGVIQWIDACVLQVYVAEVEADVNTCLQRQLHNQTKMEIQKVNSRIVLDGFIHTLPKALFAVGINHVIFIDEPLIIVSALW